MKLRCKYGHSRAPSNVDRHGNCKTCRAIRSRRQNLERKITPPPIDWQKAALITERKRAYWRSVA